MEVKKFSDHVYKVLSDDFTETERKLIAKGVQTFAGVCDEIIVVVGKHLPNGETATTGLIFAREEFQMQTVARLLRMRGGN